MINIMSGTYIGPDTRLQGQRALLREDETTGLVTPRLLAQFDNIGLVVDGIQMGFCWHLFERKDFNIDPPVKDEDDA